MIKIKQNIRSQLSSFTQNKTWFVAIILGFIALLWQPATYAQDDGTSPRFLQILQTNGDRLPSVEVTVRGIDSVGNPLDFNRFRPVIVHGSEEIGEAELLEQKDGGTFTIILVDTPPGVTDEIPALKEAVELYMGSNQMREQTDYTALYQVSAQSSSLLLEATPFHNSVRNVLIEPFPEQNGPTALVDSLGGLLESIESLKPSPDLAASIVVFSDGTDVVSTQFGKNDIAAIARTKGVPIHTVVLENQNLREPESGQNYLAELAVETGGIATKLNQEGVTAVWERISRLRQQTVLRYFLPNPTAGDWPIIVSIADYPAIQAGGQVSMFGPRPIVELDIPASDRFLTLSSITQPVRLSFPTAVRWLDGETREVTQAQLWVNGDIVADIPPEDLSRFEADVSMFQGENEIWVTLADNEAQQATSPPIRLRVGQGDAVVIPETLQPENQARLWIFAVGFISVLLLFIGLALWIWRQPELSQKIVETFLPKAGRNRPQRQATLDDFSGSDLEQDSEIAIGMPDTPALTPASNIAGHVLDILESVTKKSSPLTIDGGVEIRIGRSPASSDLTFENDITVSRLHATLVQDGESYRIFDEQSTSGTRVNAEDVPEYGRLLVDGDEIELGAVRLQFRTIYNDTITSYQAR